MNEHLAAIDIGTNSIHLVVVKVVDSHCFEVVAQEKEVVRLGSGSRDMKVLLPEAMDRAIKTLIRCRQIAEISQAKIRAVATSAVREALNQQDFLERARREAGVEIDVISGFEEARLIYLGVLQALPIYDRRTLLVDIGGGSTEFLIGQRGEIIRANSLKLGAIRLTDQFFRNDPMDPDSIQLCRQHIRAFLIPMTREYRYLGFEVAAGSSGTILNLAQMTQTLRKEEPSLFLNNYTFCRSELTEIIQRLRKADTLKKRQRLEGLDPLRADIIVAGALLLEQIFELLELESITVSNYALREGVILDSLQHPSGAGLHPLSNIRAKGVLHLADICQTRQDHAQQVARLSLQLFDQLAELHGLGTEPREYLEAASILHDVGYFISHSQHHRHSYYIIRNSEHLTGFSNREIEIIAQVARYHRKSGPKQKHPEFSLLNLRDQQMVRTLAGMLRVADGLDRTHGSLIRSLGLRLSATEFKIQLETLDGVDPTLETYTAGTRQGLMEEVFGRKITYSLIPLQTAPTQGPMAECLQG